MPCHVCKYVVRGDLYNQSGVRVLIIHAFALGIAKTISLKTFNIWYIVAVGICVHILFTPHINWASLCSVKYSYNALGVVAVLFTMKAFKIN